MVYKADRHIRFSSAPFKRPWYEIALLPIFPLCNIMIAVLVYPGWRTVRVKWVPEITSLIEFFRSQTRPIICYGWHAYELLCWLSFKVFPPEMIPTVIAHDGLLSRALHRASTWYGFPVYAFRRNSPIRPKDQLIEFLRKECPVTGVFADAGGPDRQIRQGLVDLAQASESWMVPMAMRTKPGLLVGSRQRYFIPLPFSTVTAFHGTPLDGSFITRQQCKAALDTLEASIDISYGKSSVI